MRTNTAPILTRVETVKEVAVSLFREGRFEDARAILTDELASQSGLNDTEVIVLKLCLSLVEQWDGKHDRAMMVLTEIGSLVDACADFVLRGKYYNARAYSQRRTGKRDDAIESLTAACYYHEEAGAKGLHAEAENNLGNLLVDAERFEDAHEHFMKALKNCEDTFSLAQFNESIANAYLAEGKPEDALPHALKSLQLLEGTDRTPLLKESVHTLKRVCEELERQFKADEERPQIAAALVKHSGRITAAARELGMKHQTLRWKLEHQYADLEVEVPAKKKPRGLYAVKAK